jgi:hypothetical protein
MNQMNPIHTGPSNIFNHYSILSSILLPPFSKNRCTWNDYVRPSIRPSIHPPTHPFHCPYCNLQQMVFYSVHTKPTKPVATLEAL